MPESKTPIGRASTSSIVPAAPAATTRTSSARKDAHGEDPRPRRRLLMPAPVRVGTCSWADESLSKYFYPAGLPARERLSYYAQRFSTVEVDSTYYRLPDEQTVAGWDA